MHKHAHGVRGEPGALLSARCLRQSDDLTTTEVGRNASHRGSSMQAGIPLRELTCVMPGQAATQCGGRGPAQTFLPGVHLVRRRQADTREHGNTGPSRGHGAAGCWPRNARTPRVRLCRQLHLRTEAQLY